MCSRTFPPAFAGYRLDGPYHVRDGHDVSPIGGVGQIERERFRNEAFKSVSRLFTVELDGAINKIGGGRFEGEDRARRARRLDRRVRRNRDDRRGAVGRLLLEEAPQGMALSHSHLPRTSGFTSPTALYGRYPTETLMPVVLHPNHACL